LTPQGHPRGDLQAGDRAWGRSRLAAGWLAVDTHVRSGRAVRGGGWHARWDSRRCSLGFGTCYPGNQV